MVKRHFKVRWPFWIFLLVVAGIAGYFIGYRPEAANIKEVVAPSKPSKPKAGTLIKVVESRHFTAQEVTALARQNYGNGFPVSTKGVTYSLIQYRSTSKDGKLVQVYGRTYIPDGGEKAPVIAMAPGTTGIGKGCSPSLEQPATHNWANYQSHLMAYASKGYASVITDYEGMRDSPDIQPYMVGQSEGRAVLDSIRAFKSVPGASRAGDFHQVFAVGYSQGGHAVFWADSIANSYAPDVNLAGVVGWGSVLDVAGTWKGITSGATLSWFGPHIVTSYASYYGRQYNLPNIFLPDRVNNLSSQVMAHCIDTDIKFWGTDPNKIYRPEFLADLRTGNLSADKYGPLQQDLNSNLVRNTSKTPKLVNQGGRDNVVIPAFQQPVAERMCKSSSAGPTHIKTYPQANHYNLMAVSFNDVLAWMKAAGDGKRLPTSCLQVRQ